MRSLKAIILDLMAALPVLLYQGQSVSLHIVIRSMKAVILDVVATWTVLLCQGWSVCQSLCGLHQACWMPVLHLGNACIRNTTQACMFLGIRQRDGCADAGNTFVSTCSA